MAAATTSLVSACGTVTNPALKPDVVVGRWISPSDGSLTFGPDHQFAATRLRNQFFGSQECSGRGTWWFLSSQGDGGPGTTYTSGDQIGVFGNFYNVDKQAQATNPVGFGCMDFSLISWKTNGTLGLCMDFDPDSPCLGEVYVKRSPR
jgi:hypothetical protein